jgi:hypothetical protein
MTNPKMKTKINFSKICKAFLVAGLLAAPCLATNTMAQNRADNAWAPLDTFTDGNGNTFGYWNDINNWALGVVPSDNDTNAANTFYNAAFSESVSDNVYCVVTNDATTGQLMCGFGGYGTLVITNGAHFRSGFAFGGNWTGIGYVAGPGVLIVGPGSDFTCASHLWVGQGYGSDQGTVIIDGGTLHIPNGQLGVSWNGIGGTNYITITNGGTLYLTDWAQQTLGVPSPNVTSTNVGIMEIDGDSTVVITNNATQYFAVLTNSGQLFADGGLGSIAWSYNPALNITTLSALGPAGSDTPVFSVQPSNQVVLLNGTATLTAKASPATGYQWLFNGAPLTDGTGISGSKTATLTLANFTAAETGNYSVTATNASPNNPNDRDFASSTAVSLSANSINLYPVITINGVNGTPYEVQYATSLTPPVTWTTLTTVTAGAGPIQVVDTATPLSVQRFYQVIPQ